MRGVRSDRHPGISSGSRTFGETIDALLPDGAPIILVDDGSGVAFQELFAICSGKTGVVLLRHESNHGKGAALKTAFRFVLESLPDVLTIVTADADGQHHPRQCAKRRE